MTYAAPGIGELPPVFLNSFSHCSGGRRFSLTGAPATGAWSTTNRAIYVPFTLTHTVTVYRVFWAHGTTVGTNNLMVGVYNPDFTQRFESTSTLSSGSADTCQFVTVTDHVLPAGGYYMALWANGTTVTILRTASAVMAPLLYYETNAGGLPATGAPADPASATHQLPLFGLALRSADP